MIAMLDTNDDLAQASAELGCPVEQLLTPLTRFSRRSEWFAIDNGCFSNFERDSFISLLEREREARGKCRFVSVPDVVGSARRTLEVFRYWRAERHLRVWPLALVAQDGQEALDIPWPQIEAIFIGGTTEWKMSSHAAQIVKAGKLLGKWVHVGRINSPGRFEHFEALGADSIDGTGLSRYTWMRERIYAAHLCPPLFPPADDPSGQVVLGDTDGLVGAAPILDQRLFPGPEA